MPISLDVRSERIVWIRLNLFHNFHLRRTLFLVGIKHDVYTIRNIIRVHSHTLEIVRTVYKNTDLCIVSITQIEIFNTSTNFYYTIFIRSSVASRTFITILDLNSTGINRSGILSLRPGFSAISTIVFSIRLYLRVIVVQISCGNCVIMNHRYNCSLTLVFNLGNTNAFYSITFINQNIKSVLELSFGNSHLKLNTGTNINCMFGLKFFTQTICCLLSSSLVHFSILVEPGSNGRFVNAHFSSNLRIV